MVDELNRLRRKCNQEWEMAGLARQDGDTKAEITHTSNAREYARQVGALLRGDDMVWKYEEVEIREDVEGQLPDNVQLRVYKVTSGDSGKRYYVQELKIWHYPVDYKDSCPVHGKAGSSKSKEKCTCTNRSPQIIYICNCENALGALPLAILGIADCCKHTTHLKAYLEERKK